MKAAALRVASACSSAARSLNGTARAIGQQRLEAGAEDRVAVERQRTVGQAMKRMLAMDDRRSGRVAARANLIAASTASVPELAKNTLSRYGM